MREARGDLLVSGLPLVAVTTNGYIKRNGEAVMGRGIALGIQKLIPNAQRILGEHLQKHGNTPVVLGEVNGTTFITLPVKPEYVVCNGANVVSHKAHMFAVGSIVPGWASTADLDIIVDSCHQLVSFVNAHGITEVGIPRPGCGAGELDWEEVKEAISPILDDRFIAYTF